MAVNCSDKFSSCSRFINFCTKTGTLNGQKMFEVCPVTCQQCTSKYFKKRIFF